MTTLDVGVPEEAAEIIKLAETMGPVGGIFHTALYLADKLLENQVRCLLPGTICSSLVHSALLLC